MKLERITPQSMREELERYEARHGKLVWCKCHNPVHVKRVYCRVCSRDITKAENRLSGKDLNKGSSD